MVGLAPAIHVFDGEKRDVDARNKCGHDDANLIIASDSEAIQHV
jgi:hypothetical protein